MKVSANKIEVYRASTNKGSCSEHQFENQSEVESKINLIFETFHAYPLKWEKYFYNVYNVKYSLGTNFEVIKLYINFYSF